MNLPRIPARYRPAATGIAAIVGALALLFALVVAAVWIYDHRNATVLVPVGLAYLALDVAMHWTHLRQRAALREIAERASDDADRALGALAEAPTDEIPVVVADLPRRRPRPYADDVDEQLKRFRFEGGRA